MVIAIGVCYVNVIHQSHQILDNSKDKNVLVKIYPDNVSVSDNYIHGEGTLIHPHEKILIHGVIHSRSQLREIKSERNAALWWVNADVTRIDKSTNVNQFNARQYYQSVGITNSIKINQIQKRISLNHFSVINLIHRYRQTLLIRAQSLPASLKTYTLSLILGQTSQENDPELSGVKQLGLIHLFSISGFHVYYLLGILELILAHLRIRRERYRLILLSFLPAYYVFAGASIGLLRSILMVEIGMLGRSIHHHQSSLNVWSLALILNLLIEPQSLIQFGCQLSYALSFALIYTRNFTFLKQTVCMNLVSFPFIIFNIYSWHVLTIVANLLILPMFSTVIFPVVIMGDVLSHFSAIVANVASIFLNDFDKLLNFISELPGNIYFGKPASGLVIIALLMTLLLINHFDKRLLLALIGIYLLMFITIHCPIHGEVSYFDVGQGDSFLIRTPFNRSVTIIDTGGKVNFGHGSSNYQSLRTSINYLNSRGIHTVDNICISHQDADHCGDLPAFLQNMNVKRIYIPWGMTKNQHFMNKIKPYLKATQLIQVKNGDAISGTELKVVHPFSPGLGSNADSMVLYGNIGGKRWLFMGDLDQNGENDIIQRYPNLHTDILKLGHHGSSTATGTSFLNHVDPHVAIISAGRHNRYHHPNVSVVKKVRRANVKIYNTQKDGMITYVYRQYSGHWLTN